MSEMAGFQKELDGLGEALPGFEPAGELFPSFGGEVVVAALGAAGQEARGSLLARPRTSGWAW